MITHGGPSSAVTEKDSFTWSRMGGSTLTEPIRIRLVVQDGKPYPWIVPLEVHPANGQFSRQANVYVKSFNCTVHAFCEINAVTETAESFIHGPWQRRTRPFIGLPI